ncbi:MAG: hypothetical protein ACR2NY_02340 [Alphaproteobacteria bacterium]
MTKKKTRKKLKIAVLLSGNLRTFEQTAPYLKKYLLDRYNSDVFIHAPSKIDHDRQAWHNVINKNKPISSLAIREELLTKATKLYQPKKIIINDSENNINISGVWNVWHGKNNNYKIPLTGCYRMFYHWREINKLWQNHAKKNNIKYDFIVFIRPDVMLLEPMILETYQDFFDFNQKTIVFLSGMQSIFEGATGFYLTNFCIDRIIFAKPPAMKTFLNIFHHFDRYFKKAHRLPFPPRINSSFENQQILYAAEQNLLPLCGKINHILKRMNKKDDQILIFPDRAKHSNHKMTKTMYYKFIKKEIMQFIASHKRFISRIYLMSPYINKPYRLFKKIIGLKIN